MINELLSEQDFALFAPSDPFANAFAPLEVLATGCVTDPRRLCISPFVYRRFWVAGRDLDDWMWVMNGLEPPRLDPGQYAPLPLVGFPLWTVVGYEPLRVGTPAGALWQTLEAVEDEWKHIKRFAMWDRKPRRHEWRTLVRSHEEFQPLGDSWAHDLPF